MATSKGVRSELKAVEREGGGNVAKFGAVSKAALLGVGVAAAVAAIKTVHMAADFQTQMTRVRTGAGELASNMGMVSNGVLAMAGQVGQSTASLTTGLYTVESAGFHGANALNVLRVSAMGAKVGAASLGSVTDAVTTAMNAYGLKTNDVAKTQQNATDVMNALIGTEAEGKTNMEALAGSMASILPVSSAAKVGLNEVLGAMATMTSQGTSADVAATYLRQTIGQLSNPSAKAAATMKGLGLSATAVSQELGTKGLAATLTTLTDAIKNKMGPSGTVLIDTLAKAAKSGKDYQSQLNKMSGSQKTYIGALATMVGGTKSMMGALQLTGGHMAVFQANVAGVAQHVKDGGHGIEGWADVQKTFNQRMAEAKGSIEAVAISIGQVLLPYATKMVGWLSTGVGWLTRHRSAVLVLASAIGGVLVIGLAAAAAAAWAFAGAILANPVTWIVVGVMALIAALVELVMHWKAVWTWIKTDIPGVVKVFTAAWQAGWSLLQTLWQDGVTAVQAIAKWLDDNVLKWLQARLSDLTTWWSANSLEISQAWSLVWKIVQNEASIVWSWLKTGLVVLQGVWNVAWAVIKGVVVLVWDAISNAVTFAMHAVMNVISIVLDVVTGHWGKAWSDLKKLVTQAFSDVTRFLGGLASDFGSLLYSAGTALIDGLIKGVESMASTAVDTVKNIGKSAVSGIKSILGIKSPSRVFRDEVGKWIPHGIAAGVLAHAGVVNDAMTSTADGAVKSFSDRLGIASPSKVFRQLGIWINVGLANGLTGSQAQVKSATAKTETLLMQSYNNLLDLAAKAASGKTRDGVFGGYYKSTENKVKSLESYVAKEGAVLLRLASQRDSVASRLKSAQSNLATLTKAWWTERNSVASNIMQGASVVMQSSNGGALGANDIVQNMTDQVQSATQFAGNLDKLKKMGLSTDLIAQIAGSGVSQGGATAQALASSANVAQIKQLNDMQTSLARAANNTGATVADSMYGAGIDSAKGLIKGLQSQESAIQKAMQKIADQMAKTIRKSLGIQSPSRVFHEIGTFVTAGLANGITSTTGNAVRAVSGLSSAVVRAGSAPTLSGGRSGPQVVHNHVHVEVHGTVRSDRDLRDLFQQEMLRLGGRNSVTWQPYRR
jgi:TP901 family phage tail tape measure protein